MTIDGQEEDERAGCGDLNGTRREGQDKVNTGKGINEVRLGPQTT